MLWLAILMRRKRFKHQAYILCHMFCGWQLSVDYDRLASWHSGQLLIDVLSNECFFNHEPIEPLNIVSVLNIWLLDDIQSNGIPLRSIEEAVLEVDFNVTRDPGSRRSVTFIHHNFNCLGKIRSGENLYFCRFRDMSGDQKILESGVLTEPFTSDSHDWHPTQG